ncbi:PP2C family protein-serine/threonine phosphatase [Kiloniella antarctica]|uniref:PP2C family protein-serine/threonine phosphatase n=1 Tax=Kiloniella antarctica TaxID=1550907 RepID=A0ABW5BMN0_9PROT
MFSSDTYSEHLSFKEISHRRILVVEDIKTLRHLIELILKKAGFDQIILAENGQEAMYQIVKNPPDLIILDLMMPIMGGMEVCSLVRKVKSTASIPIIVQTAMNDKEERLKAFSVGASDLITKPVDAHELVIRTKLHLKNLVLSERQEQYRRRVTDELSTAKDVQQSLLPSVDLITEIQNKTKLNVSSFFQPSSELGGDFWGTRLMEDGQVGFYMADFSGHGVVSALNTIRLHTLLFNVKEAWLTPDLLLSSINKNLCEMLPTGQYATMLMGVISPQSKQLHYTAAAAPPPIVGSWANLKNYEYLDTTGVPLGVSKSTTYEINTIDFTEDNFLFCFSDALVETKLHNKKMLDDEELISLIKTFSVKAPNPNLLNQVVATFFERIDEPIQDDLTVLSFDYL